MQRTGTKFVRTMSWVRGEVSEDAWRDEGVRRYKEMAKIAADGGIVLLHENCEGWGGLSGTHARQFIESVDHPSVRYLFDIGNTVSYGQETMPFYREILPYVEYVHIKDCRRNPAGGKSSSFTYAGEGDALVREILTELIRNGYKAGVSIEPHVASIVHLGEGTKASPQERFNSYVRYGKGLERLLADIVGGGK
jgi:sugar phosphate isomerase/epimerase